MPSLSRLSRQNTEETALLNSHPAAGHQGLHALTLSKCPMFEWEVAPVSLSNKTDELQPQQLGAG